MNALYRVHCRLATTFQIEMPCRYHRAREHDSAAEAVVVVNE